MEWSWQWWLDTEAELVTEWGTSQLGDLHGRTKQQLLKNFPLTEERQIRILWACSGSDAASDSHAFPLSLLVAYLPRLRCDGGSFLNSSWSRAFPVTHCCLVHRPYKTFPLSQQACLWASHSSFKTLFSRLCWNSLTQREFYNEEASLCSVPWTTQCTKLVSLDRRFMCGLTPYWAVGVWLWGSILNDVLCCRWCFLGMSCSSKEVLCLLALRAIRTWGSANWSQSNVNWPASVLLLCDGHNRLGI